MRLKRAVKKGVVTAVATAVLVSPMMPITAKAEAATVTESLLYGAAAVAYVNSYYGKMNNENQAEMLAKTKEKTGVYEDAEANARLDRIVDRLTATGMFKHEFAVYANPDESFNAFCTIGRVISVNKGALDILNDDELAAVVAHEMQHGEDDHCVKGATKSIGVTAAISAYLSQNDGILNYLMGAVTANYIANEMFTMSQEKNADKYAFGYVVAAGFNPGGPASAMVKLRSEVGDLWNEGLGRVVNPNNHPKTSDRIERFAKQMEEYSGGHVKVKNDTTIKVNGKEVVTPICTSYLAEQRAYLIAGNIARLYADGKMPTADAVASGNAVYVGDQYIMTVYEGDPAAQTVADALNQAISKK